MAADNLFELEIITPDRIFYTGQAKMLELNTINGQVGIYKHHVPLTTILEPGIVTITEADGIKKAAIHAGFMEILGEKITVLAEVAEWPDEIDRHRAEEAKIRAERRLSTNDANMNLTRAEMALHKALVRLELTDHVSDKK